MHGGMNLTFCGFQQESDVRIIKPLLPLDPLTAPVSAVGLINVGA